MKGMLWEYYTSKKAFFKYEERLILYRKSAFLSVTGHPILNRSRSDHPIYLSIIIGQ